MDGLAADGWVLKRELKIPHATSPNPGGYFREHELVKLWFKAQSIYISRGDENLAQARSLHIVDLRQVDYPTFKIFLGAYT